jgi:3-dehydroshikimate dehydratase
MISTGLVSVTFRALPPEEIISLVRRAGLQAIEWGGDVHAPPGDPGRAARIRGQTEDAGLEVSAYGSYYRVGKSDLPFESVLDTAAALGAPAIRVWAGTSGSSETDERGRALVVEESRRIATLAQERNIAISYEFHGGTLTDTAESAAALLAEADHPNLFTFWQPPNGMEFEDCLAGLRLVLPRVSNVHVFHWWPTHADRFPLADGAALWSEYLRVLGGTGRARFASLEFVPGDSTEVFLEEAGTLRALLLPLEPGCPQPGRGTA